METTLLQHTIFHPNKIRSEKHCLDIISNNEFKKLLFNVLNLIFKDKFIKEELHSFSFMFFVNHYESFIKTNYGQFETYLISKSKMLYNSFRKVLLRIGKEKVSYDIALAEFDILYGNYQEYYKLWKYECKYYLFIKYYEIYEVIMFNIRILTSISPSIINDYLLKYCIQVKNSFLKEFHGMLPDFKEYYNEFYVKKHRIKDYSYIFLATTKFYKKLFNELDQKDYSTIKVLNKELVKRLKDLYPDNRLELSFNDICDYLEKKDYEKTSEWINNLYNILSGSVDVKFKTNYNIWKLKNIQYYNQQHLNKLICSFYQFLHDEINLIEESRKMNLAMTDTIRLRSIMPRTYATSMNI